MHHRSTASVLQGSLCLLSLVSAVGFAGPAAAQSAKVQADAAQTAWEASRTVDENDMVTTGVAKGRDRLNSATSTSSVKENEIVRLTPRSLADLFRNIPGIRVEAGAGDLGNGYTVRGLPLVAEGAKYLQLQEDGLPVLEFGDFNNAPADAFLRADLNVSQVESIRGGSSSTFASNAPGGVINLISKTGEVEGGSIMASTGLNYGSYRLDGDYGARLGGGWRFHIGGFYREGEGPRRTGFTSYAGGQVKANVTRELPNGYLRFYAKFLDDRTPQYRNYPVGVTGTDSDPQFNSLPGFSVNRDSMFSRYVPSARFLMPDGDVEQPRFGNSTHVRALAGGFEGQFRVEEWTVTERFRYAGMQLDGVLPISVLAGTPRQIAGALSIPAPSFTYATGPFAGQPFDTTRGSGLIALNGLFRARVDSADNVTNDLRASRVWTLGDANLTTTAGLYASRQTLNQANALLTAFQDVRGDGRSALLNVAAASGLVPLTQNGILLNYALGTPQLNRGAETDYRTIAPYGSFNYQTGPVAIGGSLRYDIANVEGMIHEGRIGCYDFNGDGVTRAGTPECQTVVFTPGAGRPVDYGYRYLSYSTGINLRLSDPFAVFARYSKGGRGGAGAILFSSAIDRTSGDLVAGQSGYDRVRQAEAGVKYRHDGLTLNATGFYATTQETNTQLVPNAQGITTQQLVSRRYRAYGVEMEGAVRRGPFSLTANGTLADASITAAESAALVGNTPRHQPAFIYRISPQYDGERFSIGANVIGVTRSYAQDVNRLRLPAYTTVGLYAQVRPVDRVELGISATNLFDANAIVGTLDAAIPATGIAQANTLYGRLISTSVRLFF
ncbi:MULTISPECIES: TonB-dependent receptor [unclassified Sphingomonas]|uniref:TonB-dependent receptor n=1 Tax=unclassified Sphingomonas TaxID=196159 RepID=UPI0009E962E6|nr:MULTISPECIES: TonB-dependent receptor [unclassified Sphingomonas]